MIDHYTPEQRAKLDELCVKHRVLDFSRSHSNPPKKVLSRGNPKKLISLVELRAGKAKVRKPEDITGIGYHQMAVNIGVSAQQIKAAGGDRKLARNIRAPRIAAHVLAFRDDTIIHNFPFLWHVYHGNRLNPFTIGLEMEGVYDGDEHLNQTTDETMETFRRAVRFIKEFGDFLGCQIDYGFAHRQASDDRVGDPGAENWQEVALWAEKELNIVTRPDFVIGTGLPIPHEWDPRQDDPYRGKR